MEGEGHALGVALQEGSRGVQVGEEREIGFAGETDKDPLDVGEGLGHVDSLQDGVVGKGVWDRGGEHDDQLAVALGVPGDYEVDKLLFWW